MPYKTDKIRLKPDQDRRIKLTEEDKKEIIELSERGKSQRWLADFFGVSRRLIQFIIFPEKLAENKKRREERGGWRIYYDKEKHAQYTRSHRRYKHEILG